MPTFSPISPSSQLFSSVYPVTQAKARFGNDSKGDAYSGNETITLESVQKQFPWIAAVANPKVTAGLIDDKRKVAEKKQEEKLEKYKERTKKTGKKEGPAPSFIIRSILQSFWRDFRFAKVLRSEKLEKAKRYLPPSVKKSLSAYKWWFYQGHNYFLDRLLSNKATAKKRMIEIQGPPVIKAEQASVTDLQPAMEFGSTALGFLKNKKTFYTMLKSDPQLSFIMKMGGRRIAIAFLNYQIKKFNIRKQVMDNVTQSPASEYKKDLDALGNALKSKGLTLSGSPTPLRSASIAQTFKDTVTDAKGVKTAIILKALRPSVSPEKLLEYKQYLYYQNLIELGTSPAAKWAAAEDAELNVQFLVREAHLPNEFNAMVAARERQKSLGTTGFDIPQPLAVSPSGRALAQSVAGNTNFSELTMAQTGKLLSSSGSDIIAYQLFSPIKHLDFTRGNLMTQSAEGSSPVQLTPTARTAVIDWGRHLDVDVKKHEALLSLMQAYLVAKGNSAFIKPEKFVQQPEVLKAFESLANGTAYKTDLITIKTKDPSTPAYKKAMDSIERVLVSILDNNKSYFNDRELRKEVKNEENESQSLHLSGNPSLVDVLYNYMAFNALQKAKGAHGLSPISDTALPIREIKDIRKKFYGSMANSLLAPYPANSQQHRIEEELKSKTITPQLIRSLFNNLQEIGSIMGTDLSGLIQAADNDKQGLKGFDKELEKLAKTPKAKDKLIKKLQLAYRLDQRLSEMSKQIASYWPIESRLSKADEVALTKGITSGLANDFKDKLESLVKQMTQSFS